MATNTRTRIIMSNAWLIARRASQFFGGSRRQYLSEALRMAWQGYTEYTYIMEVLPSPTMHLTGTDEQIALAQDIIRRMVDEARSDILHRAYRTHAVSTLVDRWTQLMSYVSRVTSADMWIDLRNTSLPHIVREWWANGNLMAA